jgi:hypothetical protein
MNKNRKSITSLWIQTLLFILLVSLFVCIACDDDFSLGEEYIESQANITTIDTLSVRVSTVLLDTLDSSGAGCMLVGRYRDDNFGEFSSTSYFQIGIPDFYDIEMEDRYDSLNLILLYNQYWFGDTTKTLTLSVHPLTENIEYDYDNNIEKNTTFNYDPQPIGSITFAPKPHAEIDTVSIRLSDNLGYELFSKMQNESDQLAGNENFVTYFPGLLLMADNNSDGIIIGFDGEEDEAKVVLHSSRDDVATEHIRNEFGLYDASKQFNSISGDLSATQLSGLAEQKIALPSSESDGLSYLQGGTGLAIKIEFPSLSELLLQEQGKIVEAKLSLAPLASSYKDFELPSELNIYKLDKDNRVFGGQSSLVLSSLVMDELYGEDTIYTFDLTSYLIEEFSDSYVDPKEGLLIALPSYDTRVTFERLIVDAEHRNTQIKIHYLSY